jgi:hypothetical protein
MSFDINPCYACLKKFSPENSDINNINNCCYETLAAFKGTDNVNSIRDAQACVECVTAQIYNLDRTRCDFQIQAPPIFNQSSHYFPELYSKSLDKEKSKNECLNMCKTNRYPNECAINCVTDADAVESFSTFKQNNKKEQKTDQKQDPTYKDYEKAHPKTFSLVFIIMSLILAFFIGLFIFKIYYSQSIVGF